MTGQTWEIVAIVAVPSLVIFGAIVGLYTRLASIETMLKPMWEWWIKTNGK